MNCWMEWMERVWWVFAFLVMLEDVAMEFLLRSEWGVCGVNVSEALFS